ncbi:MAG: YlxR family protein [Symbiobacteriaceae bacterium]|nr:YlxR family protein [Symbiobacteriaceae bacterium]
MKPRKIPQRMCIGCQQMRSKREMVRVVRTPEGEILIDESGKKSGRGAYLCPQVSCLQAAVKAKRLQRVLETPIPEDVWQDLQARMEATTPGA